MTCLAFYAEVVWETLCNYKFCCSNAAESKFFKAFCQPISNDEVISPLVQEICQRAKGRTSDCNHGYRRAFLLCLLCLSWPVKKSDVKRKSRDCDPLWELQKANGLFWKDLCRVANWKGLLDVRLSPLSEVVASDAPVHIAQVAEVRQTIDWNCQTNCHYKLAKVIMPISMIQEQSLSSGWVLNECSY